MVSLTISQKIVGFFIPMPLKTIEITKCRRFFFISDGKIFVLDWPENPARS
jgi:hypothetical protein